MKKTVTVARALKEKNRIAGRLAFVRELVNKENSHDRKIPRAVDVLEIYKEAKSLRNRLIGVKTAIAVANRPIVGKIIELDEVKSEIAYLNGLEVKEGCFPDGGYGYRIDAEFDAIIRKQQVLDEQAALQAKADKLQDELDEFNAVTKVEIDIE